MLISQTKSFSKVYIVVDALDECLDDIDTNTRNRFLKALDELPQQVHILYTSRPINSIGQKIQADRELEIVANGDDLRKYFDSRIKNVDNLKALVDVGVKKDSQFLKKVLNTIVTRCQGMQVFHLNDSMRKDFADINIKVSARAISHCIPCISIYASGLPGRRRSSSPNHRRSLQDRPGPNQRAKLAQARVSNPCAYLARFC